jgi:predicted dienelactone hydrolase
MSKNFLGLLVKCSLGALAALISSPGFAADQISINYPPFGAFYVSVQDLTTFANTGEVTSSFAYYANKVKPWQLKHLREILIKPFPVNSVETFNFFQTQLGKEVLTQAVKLINTPKDESKPALEGALISAAENPKGLTIIEVLQKFSLPTINVDLSTVVSTVDDANELLRQTEHIFSTLPKQNRADSSPTNLDFEHLLKPGKVSWHKESLIVNPISLDNLINASVYLPEGLKEPAPLVVIAPGLNTDIKSLEYVAKHLASHGFGIIAIDFPQTDSQRITSSLNGLDTIPRPNAWIEQPLEVSLVLDAVKIKIKSDPLWQGKLNLNNVGILGQSLGGYTSMGSGGALTAWPNVLKKCQEIDDPNKVVFNPALIWQCQGITAKPPTVNMQDNRIKALIAINPVTNPIFNQDSVAQMKTPIMIISGSSDVFSPAIPEQIRPFTWLTQPDKYLLLVKNSTHLSFLDGTSNIPAAIVGPAPNVARNYLKVLSLVFFNIYLMNQTQYQKYLTPLAVSALSQDPLPTSIIRNLTPQELQKAIHW